MALSGLKDNSFNTCSGFLKTTISEGTVFLFSSLGTNMQHNYCKLQLFHSSAFCMLEVSSPL